MKIKKLSKFRYPRRKQRGISAKFPPSATDNFSPQENLIKRFSVPQNPKRILQRLKISVPFKTRSFEGVGFQIFRSKLRGIKPRFENNEFLVHLR